MNQPRKDLIYVDKIEWIIALDEEKNKLVMETRNELRANFDKMVSQLDESDDIPVFDEKKAWAEAVEISLGLPQSAVVKIDHAPETDKEMYFMTRDALMSKYNIGYDDAIVLGEIENYDIARPNEIRKQMAIDGLNGVLKGDGLKKYLDNTKNFQHFSHLNRLTVLCHYPNATMVKTHGAWKALGRYPRKGEKAIPLTRPLIKEHTFTDEQALATFRDNYNSNSCSLDHICDDEYKKYRDEIRKNGTVTFGLLDSFIPIYEFELSQTDGKPIVEDKPTPCDVTVLTGMIDAMCNGIDCEISGTLFEKTKRIAHKYVTSPDYMDRKYSNSEQYFIDTCTAYMYLNEHGYDVPNEAFTGLGVTFRNRTGFEKCDMFNYCMKACETAVRGLKEIENILVKKNYERT